MYYIELQRRVQDVFLYISCHEDNFSAFSIKIESIIIDICSFFDSLCQVFIKTLKLKGHIFKEENEIKDFNKKADLGIRGYHFSIIDYKSLLFIDLSLHDKEVILDYGYPIPVMYSFYLQRTSGTRGHRIRPFSDWSVQDSPSWWQAFTDLKHDRMTNFKKASLKNAIDALAAVFIVVTFMNEDLFREGGVSEEVYNLFSIQYWPQTGSVSTGRPRYSRR